MYISFVAIKYTNFIIWSKSSPVPQLQIYYLRKSFSSEQQRCSDRLHALYSWVLRFVPVSCNRQNVTYVSCSAANRNIQCCYTMLLCTAQSRPHHCVCISKAITTQQKRYNACYSLWLPVVSIYSVQLSVYIVYCGKEQVIVLPRKMIEAVSFHRQKSSSATKTWTAKISLGLF